MGQLTDPDDPPWSLRERISLAWDQGSIRWLVGALVVVVVIVGLLAMRSRPVESVAAPQIVRTGTPAAQVDSQMLPGGSKSGSPTSSESPGVVIVHVTGPVRRPGVFTLAAGSRVIDAVDAAGGVTKGQVRINLARVLIDGEQLDVGAAAEAPNQGVTTNSSPPGTTSGGAGAGTVGGQPGGKVSLNKATSAQLEELPQVGPVTAAKIIEFRTQYGGFRSVDQLREVSGIGDKTFAQLAPLVQL